MSDLVVRRLRSGEAVLLRALRLEALGDAPQDFDTPAALAATWSPADWERWLAERAVFVTELEGRVAGIAYGERHDSDRLAVFLGGLWVRAEARGHGAAPALVEAVVAWATERGSRTVWLDVRRANDRALELYERCGFALTGDASVAALSGEVEVRMRRDLEPADAAEPPRLPADVLRSLDRQSNVAFVLMLGVAWLQMKRVDAGWLTSYGADVFSPAVLWWLLRRSRFPHTPRGATQAALLVGAGCFVWEISQAFDVSGTPLAIAAGTFDPWDLVVYTVTLVACVAWERRMVRRATA